MKRLVAAARDLTLFVGAGIILLLVIGLLKLNPQGWSDGDDRLGEPT